MFISFSGAEEVTTYVTISWEESEDENLKNYPTNINQKALGSEDKSVNETKDLKSGKHLRTQLHICSGRRNAEKFLFNKWRINP